MDKNVGGRDRVMRILAGALAGFTSLVILVLELEIVNIACETEPLFSPVLGILAIVLLGTAYTQKCPICKALGHSSYEKQDE